MRIAWWQDADNNYPNGTYIPASVPNEDIAKLLVPKDKDFYILDNIEMLTDVNGNEYDPQYWDLSDETAAGQGTGTYDDNGVNVAYRDAMAEYNSEQVQSQENDA